MFFEKEPLYELNTNTIECSDQFIMGTVLARPSAKVRSPYLADVRLDNGDMVLCHCPSLGCCGLISPGARVHLMSRPNLEQTKTAPKSLVRSTHIVYHVDIFEPKIGVIFSIGTHPLVSNHLARAVLMKGLLARTGIPQMRKMRSETKLSKSRFDFTGVDIYGKTWICEVKNVPIADYVDASPKERKNDNINTEKYDWCDKLAMFPDGFRKVQTEPVSMRALKHARELTDIAQEGVCRALLLFVVQRIDCRAFTVTKLDPTYRAAIIEAKQLGVRIRAISVSWDGPVAYYHGELPVLL